MYYAVRFPFGFFSQKHSIDNNANLGTRGFNT